jgi:hypothetical protein
MIPEPFFTKIGMHIIAPEPISTAYLINPSDQYVCLYVYPSIVARQRLGKNVTVGTNTHAIIEELLATSFSMWSVSYQKKVGNLFTELVLSFINVICVRLFLVLIYTV